MTFVEFVREKNIIKKVTVSGHALSAEYGNDIVCSSISILTQSVINGIILVVGENNKFYKLDEDSAKIEINLPNVSNDIDRGKVDILLETLYLNLKILSNRYKKYLDFSEKEER